MFGPYPDKCDWLPNPKCSAEFLIIPPDQLEILNNIPGWTVTTGKASNVRNVTAVEKPRNKRESRPEIQRQPVNTKRQFPSINKVPFSSSLKHKPIQDQWYAKDDWEEYSPVLNSDLVNRFCRSLPDLRELSQISDDRNKTQKFPEVMDDLKLNSTTLDSTDQELIKMAKRNGYILQQRSLEKFIMQVLGENTNDPFACGQNQSRSDKLSQTDVSLMSLKSFENNNSNNVFTCNICFYKQAGSVTEKNVPNASSDISERLGGTSSVAEPTVAYQNPQKRAMIPLALQSSSSGEPFDSQNIKETVVLKKYKVATTESSSKHMSFKFSSLQVIKMMTAICTLCE